MDRLPRISVIVCTRDRPRDLAELLHTLLNQTYPPFEVIVVDDSLSNKAKEVVNSFHSRSNDGELRYVKGCGDGLPAARNLGVKISRGDAILFLDDDTLLQNNVLHAFATSLSVNQNALGVQGQIRGSLTKSSNDLKQRIEIAMYKAFMLSYYKQNKLAVRKSGKSIFPYSHPLTAKIDAQRLDGCCMCYRRELFDELSFDTNLKLWGFMEDLDFSFRVYKKRPGSLYAIPSAMIIHKKSTESRLPSRTNIYMTTVYWFYVFFKGIHEESVINLIAFLWALTGNLITITGGLVIKRKPKPEWWKLIYTASAYAKSFKNLKAIRTRKLDFFNNMLTEWE